MSVGIACKGSSYRIQSSVGFQALWFEAPPAGYNWKFRSLFLLVGRDVSICASFSALEPKGTSRDPKIAKRRLSWFCFTGLTSVKGAERGGSWSLSTVAKLRTRAPALSAARGTIVAREIRCRRGWLTLIVACTTPSPHPRQAISTEWTHNRESHFILFLPGVVVSERLPDCSRIRIWSPVLFPTAPKGSLRC